MRGGVEVEGGREGGCGCVESTYILDLNLTRFFCVLPGGIKNCTPSCTHTHSNRARRITVSMHAIHIITVVGNNVTSNLRSSCGAVKVLFFFFLI